MPSLAASVCRRALPLLLLVLSACVSTSDGVETDDLDAMPNRPPPSPEAGAEDADGDAESPEGTDAGATDGAVSLDAGTDAAPSTDGGMTATDAGGDAAGADAGAEVDAAPPADSGAADAHVPCAPDHADCNADRASDGCEVDLADDPAHCGACDHACPSVPQAAATCVDASCGSECWVGFEDCNGDRAADGCETALDVDPAHCGTCDRACPEAPYAVATCSSGSCGSACLDGHVDCNGLSPDGCERDVENDPDHCGSCDGACSDQHMAARTCEQGSCRGACERGFADCNDDMRSDGCETPVSDDVNHCGGCGVVCPGSLGRGCVAGVCNETCDDGIRNHGESDVDCGGPCGECEMGDACRDGSDCSTGFCRADQCAAVMCANGHGLPGPARIEAQETQTGVAVGDFNGDGRPDVAISNFTRDTVTVALGREHGSFHPPVHYPTGDGPRNISAGDLDGDGHDDLVVSNWYDSSVSVLMADRDGGFAPPVILASAGGPQGSALGDVNGDGSLDLTVGVYQGGVMVHLNSGDGTFGAPTRYFNGSGSQTLAVALGDLNGDDRLDLALTSDSTAVAVLLNVGDGTFGAATEIAYGIGGPRSVATVDMNADGLVDIVASTDVLLQETDGTFTRPLPFDGSAAPDPVAVADFDGDGSPDIAAVVRNPSDLHVRLNDGSGVTTPGRHYLGGISPHGVVASDVDGNGFMDLIVISESVAAANVLLNDGNAEFVARTEYETGLTPKSTAFGDVNGDGKLDIVTTSSNEFTSSSNTVSVLFNEGDMSFAPALNHATGRRPVGVVVGDFDGDGLPDIANANFQDKTVSILRSLGDGSFEPYRELDVGAWAKTVLSADFNGDGRLDLVADTPYDIIRVFLNGGQGRFTARDLPLPGTDLPFGTTQSIAVGDLDGDGDTDLVRIQRIFLLELGRVPTVAKYINRGDGTFTGSHTILPKNPLAVLMGDPWHEGRDQYVLVNQDDTVTVNGTDYATGLGAQTVALGEVDGDGIQDLVVGAGTLSFDVFLGKADHTLENAVSYSARGGAALGVADLDGDGRAEVVTGNGRGIDVIPNLCLP